MTSTTVHTVKTGSGIVLTLIEVDLRGRLGYQLYDQSWSLIGMFRSLPDASAGLESWRQYLAAHGGSLASWGAAHPDGVQLGEHP
jgi:hypothetical protein